MANVVVLLGRLARPPESREMPSGQRLVAYEVTIDRPGEGTETVPVVWLDAPANAGTFVANDAVLIVGRVRRRFFRAGGGTQSRTEVIAETVVGANHPKRAAKAIERAQSLLAEVGF